MVHDGARALSHELRVDAVPRAAHDDDVRILRDIEQYYSTQIDEMPMNVADLI